MAVLGSMYHDFPRVAKQSGFYFQLSKGRVNWTELENLDIDEITQNRNFRLLEQNLINVLNCDLEREYDLKILDQNFVKLFKLAQLGVDYLSYCEMYLDRCVVLLQEQLTAFQQDYECLKQENEKKKEELNRSKRKNKVQSYQCEKCEKAFISDVYLKFHDKRRHSSPSTPQSLDESQKKAVTDSCQQTENGRMLSTSTQTIFYDEATTQSQENEESQCLKLPMDHLMKMEKLEQELEDFKERLKKAETSLREKNETSKSCTPFHLPGSTCCNSILMLLPSYLKQSGNGFYEIKPGCPISQPVTELNQQANPSLSPAFNSEKVENNPITEKSCPKENSLLNTQSGKIHESESELPSEVQKCDIVETLHNYHEEDLKHDKENIDPNVTKSTLKNLTPPLPPPRKLKKEIQAPVIIEEIQTEEKHVDDKKDTHSEEETDFNTSSIVPFCNSESRFESTPFKEKQDGVTLHVIEGSEVNLSDIHEPKSILNEEPKSRETVSQEEESQTLLKKIKENSPKLQKFSKNLKRSLTNLYDAVSFEKDSKCKESDDKTLRTTVVSGLNNRLKQLGVDPEWSGIPKKTMKQKLNALKHGRRLLWKENPMYPAIRQSIEEKIFQKLKKNFSLRKTIATHKLNKEGLMNAEGAEVLNTQDDLLSDKPEFVKVKNCPMYDIDSDSESKTSDSESDFNEDILQKTVVVEELGSDVEEKVDVKKDQDFDLSVFQVGGGNLHKRESPKKHNPVCKVDDLIMDSDSEENLLEKSDNKAFKTLNLLSYKNESGNNNIMDSSNNVENPGKTNSQNQSILKGEGFQSRISMNSKKKVLFANYSNIIDEELSDSPLDDDLWSLKSDWEKDAG